MQPNKTPAAHRLLRELRVHKLRFCRSPDVSKTPSSCYLLNSIVGREIRPVLFAWRYMRWLQEMVSSKGCILLELEGSWIFGKRMWIGMLGPFGREFRADSPLNLARTRLNSFSHRSDSMLIM